MAGGRFSKQAIYASSKYFNSPTVGDNQIGGLLSGAPQGFNANQGFQTLPGDRVIFAPADALVYSNNNVGNLYTGTYRYVATRNNSTSVPAAGRGAFWDISALSAAGNAGANAATDELYQVTSDEAANIGVALFAGAFINNVAQGNYWWIQESGKMSLRFRGNNGTVLFGGANITGTPTIGAGVYLAAVGNNANNNVGLFDQLVGANSAAIFTANSTTAYNAVDQMITRFVGVAEQLPTNGNITLVDVNFWRGGYRW
jgi:hypothetical protein